MVVHEGEVLLRESVGYRDAEKKLKPDADTIYMLGSCSKMLTSAAVGILVDEAKLQCQDPIQKYLPEFNPEGDPRIGQDADLIDALRHSTGIVSPFSLIFGSRGSILTSEDGLIPLLNIMPTADKDGQRFNRHWDYNNFPYGLMAKVVERVTGQQFADFVWGRILVPLGTTRIALTRADIKHDDNVAAPYGTLKDGSFVQLNSDSWPCDSHPTILAATGMRSSINDMLRWCIAVLSAERTETQLQREEADTANPISHTCLLSAHNIRNSPLKHMVRVRRGYWTRPADDPSFSKDAAYCMGWLRMELPSSKLSCFSGNYHSQEKEHQMHLKYILGRESPAFPTIGHTGGMRGAITTVWTFPDTQSAVVTMTNGRDFGDASDFSAQILVQALFDLVPRVDLIPWVKMEAVLARKFFGEHLVQPWRENRQLGDSERDPMCYVGEYRGFHGLFTISVVANVNGKIAVIFNHCEMSTLPLVFFRRDTYSFFSDDWDTFVADSMVVQEHQQCLLQFEVDCATERVTGLWWAWNKDEKAAWLRRVE